MVSILCTMFMGGHAWNVHIGAMHIVIVFCVNKVLSCFLLCDYCSVACLCVGHACESIKSPILFFVTEAAHRIPYRWNLKNTPTPDSLQVGCLTGGTLLYKEGMPHIRNVTF